jgi:hypothetical protein
MNLCALQQQGELRDLARLHEWDGEVSWLEADALASCPDPAVLAGFWLQEDPPAARRTLVARAEMGASTLIVPRLPNLNYREHVNAPADLEVRHKTFQEVHFDDDRAYAIPGQAVIQSPLANGKWGISEFGQGVVLACRATENLGWIIFCTASLCSRTIGVAADDQLELLAAILKRAAKSATVKPSVPSSEQSKARPADLDGLLTAEGPSAAPWLLAILGAGGSREEGRVQASAKRLGLALDDAFTLTDIPDGSLDQIIRALKQHGWAAHVRRISQFLQEDSTHE